MENIYDILSRLNAVLNQPKDQAASINEGAGDYSAKKASAGKDIGKPGKQFAKIAKSAGERYGSKERGEKVAGAVLAKLRAKESIDEAEVEEGNDFTKARLDAIKAGKSSFKVDGKTYRVTGDTSDEKAMEAMDIGLIKAAQKTSKEKPLFVKDLESERNIGKRYGYRSDEEPDDDDAYDEFGNLKPGRKKAAPAGEKRGRGRPKGSRRAIGAKGPTGRSKLLRMSEDYDKDEYDEEGEMAKSQARTIEDAAEELQSILDSDENLPEWAQKKISLAKEYIDSARDYLKANRPEQGMMSEKAVSKAQRAAAGIAYAAKKGDIPRSELRGASKEMAKMPAGELKKFAKTKEKGLPEKAKKESKDEVEETTVAGSVATAEAPSAKKSKGGIEFGKGIYEELDARLESMIQESMSVNVSSSTEGGKNITVTATDEDAEMLAKLLALSGMTPSGESGSCPTCGHAPCGCEQVDEDYANSPEEETRDTEYMIKTISGGLNGPKMQVNPNNPGDNPLAMKALGRGPMALNLEEQAQQRLMDLFKEVKQQ